MIFSGCHLSNHGHHAVRIMSQASIRAQPEANVIDPRNEDREHSQPAFKVFLPNVASPPLPPEAVKLKTPPAALPGANLLKRLINRF